MSVMGAKVPGGLNSRVVPKASPMARPRRQPRKRLSLLGSALILALLTIPPGKYHLDLRLHFRRRPVGFGIETAKFPDLLQGGLAVGEALADQPA